MRRILIILFYILFTEQSCLDQNGNVVDWWAILKVPPKIGSSGFGYIDSTSQSTNFKYYSNHVDEGKTALTFTLNQINEKRLETVSWNDQKPTGQVSTTSAHSKGLISFSFEEKKGFLLSHSIPKYPAFDGDKVINTIAPAQNYYGQNLFCISMSVSELNKLANKLITTHIYNYQSSVKNRTETSYLYQLGLGYKTTPSVNFQYEEFNPAVSVNLKAIFKNGGDKNCSIFEDGLTSYLKQNLTAESWGRPLQKSWCHTPYSVTNVVKVSVGSLMWTEADDHSKWVVSSSYGCFGDMNRMDSQWKRGGSFFCLNNAKLASALRKSVIEEEKCKTRYLRID